MNVGFIASVFLLSAPWHRCYSTIKMLLKQKDKKQQIPSRGHELNLSFNTKTDL